MAKPKTPEQPEPPTVQDPPNEPSGSVVVSRGIKIAGEALVAPGSSLILDGDIVRGGIHLVGGLLAKAAIGPLGWFLIAANSYTKSVTGSHLYESIKCPAGEG